MPSSTPHIVLLTCLWRRRALTELALRWYAGQRKRLRNVLCIHLLAVGSEGASSRSLATRHGWTYVEHTNRPLGLKWNAGATAARSVGADALLVTGSDDFMSDSLVEYYAAQVGTVDFLGVKDFHVFDLRSKRSLYFVANGSRRRGHPIGSGRLLGRSLLDKLHYQPWLGKLDRGLDRGMMTRCEAVGVSPRTFKLADVPGGALVGVKTSVNIWPFSTFTAIAEPANSEAVLAPFGADFVRDLYSLQG